MTFPVPVPLGHYWDSLAQSLQDPGWPLSLLNSPFSLQMPVFLTWSLPDLPWFPGGGRGGLTHQPLLCFACIFALALGTVEESPKTPLSLFPVWGQ